MTFQFWFLFFATVIVGAGIGRLIKKRVARRGIWVLLTAALMPLALYVFWFFVWLGEWNDEDMAWFMAGLMIVSLLWIPWVLFLAIGYAVSPKTKPPGS